MVATLDVGFKDYVVFHRGIAECSIQDDGHLHVIYQDGTDQDLGDPFGDEARREAAEAQALIEQLQGLINEGKVADAVAAKEALDQAIAEANELVEKNEVGTETFNNAVEDIVNTNISESIQAIEGVSSKEVEDGQGNMTTVYYVENNINLATDEDIDTLFA